MEEGWNVRQAEARAKNFTILPPEDLPPKDSPDPHLIYVQAVEKDLSARLGRKVTIKNGAKKGRLELEYYNVDDLNDLLDQLERIIPLEKTEDQEVEG